MRLKISAIIFVSIFVIVAADKIFACGGMGGGGGGSLPVAGEPFISQVADPTDSVYTETPEKKPADKDEKADPVNLTDGKFNYSATDIMIKGRKLNVVIRRSYRNDWTVNGTVNFTANAYDPDGSVVRYEWHFPPQAYNITGQNTATPSCNFIVPGTYSCSYQVEDNSNMWSGLTDFNVPVEADTKSGRFGYNWDMSFNLKVLEVNDTSIMFFDGQNYRVGYQKITSSTPAKYVSQTDITNYFLKEDGLFTLYEKFGMKYRFDCDGCISKIEDSFGNSINLSYAGSGLYKMLTTITDDLNRNISLTYSADGRLNQIRTFDGRAWQYQYNSVNNNLEAVTNPLGGQTSYYYDGRHNLTAITDPNGNTWLTNTYDSNDRVVVQQYGDGNYSFTYDPNNHLTIVKDRSDINSLNFYNDSGSIVSDIVYAENNWPGCASFSQREPNLISYWKFEENIGGTECGCQDPCVITDVLQLQNINNNLAGCYVLGCDIDASATANWNNGAGFVPIGTDGSPFTGCFDAKGYVINGLHINRPTTNYVGLFGKTSSAVIKNLGLTNVNISGMSYVGAIAGWCDSGTISKCYSSGTISGSTDVTPPNCTLKNGDIWDVMPYSYNNCPPSSCPYNSMKVVDATDSQSPPVMYNFDCDWGSTYDSGWIVGTPNTSGNVVKSGITVGSWTINANGGATYTAMNIGGSNCWQVTMQDAAGNWRRSTWRQIDTHASGGSYSTYSNPKLACGGLIGYSKGDISNSYSVASVSGYDSIGGLLGELDGGSATNCYSAGAVSGTSNLGGFCGLKSNGAITNCFYDTQTSGRSDSGKGSPQTTAQMKQQATFTNWDFNIIWNIVEGSSYPYLIYGQIVYDSIGRNNGRAFLPQSTQGKVGNALRFVQNGDNVFVKDSGNLDLSQFTISAWIYKDASTDYAGIVTKCDASSSAGCNYDLRESTGGKIEIRCYDGYSIKSVVSQVAVSTGQWHYIVATCDGVTLRLYIDGIKAASPCAVAGPLSTGTRDLYIGSAFNNGNIDESRTFKGKIDEVKIYGAALSYYQIEQEYKFNGKYITEYQHDANRNITRIIYPAGNCTDFTYDSVGNVSSICKKPSAAVSCPNIVTSYTYDNNFSYVKTVTDPRGNVTTFNYDSSNGNLNNIVFPQVSTPNGNYNPVVSFTYNQFGQVITVTSPDGIVTTYQYYSTADNNDPNYGKLQKIIVDSNTGGLMIATKFQYDMQGNVIEIKDPMGQITKFAYNQLDLLTQIMSPLNHITNFSYNLNKMLIKTERANGTDPCQTVNYSYNILDDLVSVVNPLGYSTNYSCDKSQRLSSVTDAQQNTDRFSYDIRGFVWEANDAVNNVTEHCYNENGRLSAIVDANGNETDYDYDDFDRLTTITYPDGSQESFAYDAASNITGFTNRAGQTIAYQYDALNRVVQKDWPGSQRTIKYRYDIAGRIVDVNDNGSLTQYSYDRVGRVIQINDPENRIIKYEYDNLGRRTKLTYPDNTYITYQYDADNRLTKIKYQDVMVSKYTCDDLGRRTLLEYGNGTNAAYLYDIGDRLTRITNNISPVIDIQYTDYDSVGNRKNMIVSGIGTTTYTYDRLYQLTFADYPAGFVFSDSNFYYDCLGSRTQVIADATTTYKHNKLNQYDSVGTTNYSYDIKGNLTNDGTDKYYYDCQNRLTDVNTVAGSRVSHYDYDYQGRRTQKTEYSNQKITKFCYDGEQIIAEFENGVLVRKYVYGPAIDEPVCMITVSGQNETKYYYHYDGLGSVVALSDSSGNKVEQYNYDAFGTPSGTMTVGNRFLFTGRQYDSETSLYYYRARYYKPSIGRFLQSDPIGYGSSINLYLYCGNNPICYLDPYGLDWLDTSANFCAGMGDTLSCGLTGVIRRAIGVDSVVNHNSTSYSAGEWTGVGLMVAMGVAGGIEAAGVKTAENEFCHFIPTRYGGPRSILNGNYVTPYEHYLVDGYRYVKGWKNLGPKLPQVIRQIVRIPNIYKGAAAGLAVGLAHKKINDNINSDSMDAFIDDTIDDSEFNDNISEKTS